MSGEDRVVTTIHRFRNGAHGYGLVSKSLHLLVVVAIAAQLLVGYLLDGDESGRGRGRGRGEESGRGRGRGGGYEPFADGLLTVHDVLGVTILVLATARLLWRLSTPLPRWAPTLSHFERALAHWSERALYLLMFAIPASGLLLVAADDDNSLGFYVASHIAFFVVLALHVGLVLEHELVNRNGLLRRTT